MFQEHQQDNQKTATERAMTFQNTVQAEPRRQSDPRRDESNLDRRYGKIGISAVAAAMRYQSDAKNPAYAPVTHRERRELSEAVA
jgi:hypothetical protein